MKSGILIMLLLITPAGAQEKIAEEQVALNGYVGISGRVLLTGYATPGSLSNIPFLNSTQYIYENDTNQIYAVTDKLTSKNRDNWSLNFSFDGYYSDYSVTFYLPPGSEVSRFELSPGLDYQLQVKNDSLAISAQGYRVASPGMEIEYRQTLDLIERPDGSSTTWIYPVILLVLISLIVIVLNKRIRRSAIPDKKVEQKATIDRKEIHITAAMKKVIDTLSENEKAIIDFLVRNGGRATQAEIRYETGIPKSSLSGIINALKRRNILKKREYGRTNVIELSELFLSENEVS